MKSRQMRIHQFGHALTRLQEVLALPEDSVVRDASIQRFEFTFETAWKAIQADASAEGVDCASPRDCLRAAVRMSIVDAHEKDWLQMIEDRNRTSHTYDEDIAAEIYRSLSRYSELFQALLSKLGHRERQRLAEENRDSGATPAEGHDRS